MKKPVYLLPESANVTAIACGDACGQYAVEEFVRLLGKLSCAVTMDGEAL